MKKYYDNEYANVYYVGETTEVKALYKSICRAGQRGSTGIFPLYEDFPIFSEGRSVYGLCVTYDNTFVIINSDTILSLILKGDVSEQETGRSKWGLKPYH